MCVIFALFNSYLRHKMVVYSRLIFVRRHFATCKGYHIIIIMRLLCLIFTAAKRLIYVFRILFFFCCVKLVFFSPEPFLSADLVSIRYRKRDPKYLFFA